MHSPVIPEKNKNQTPPEVRLISVLSRHLLSASDEYSEIEEWEAEMQSDASRCISSLDAIVRRTFPITALETPVKNMTPSEQAKPYRAPSPIQYASDRKEYQSALNNPETLQALLNLKNSDKLRSKSSVGDSDHFKTLNPPAVEAKLKSTTATKRTLMSRIFRSREELP